MTEWNALYGSNILRQAALNIYPFSMCNRTYASMQCNSKSQLCVGDLIQNKDSCQGDSGYSL